MAVRRAATLALAVATVFVAGCAGIAPRSPIADPFERVNRVSYRFDRMLDSNLIEPLARVYVKGDPEKLPGKLRNRVSDFFTNLLGPIDITNNLLQGKLKRGFSGIGRLLVNSTVGLGGIFDPASRWGMPRYAEDFGQTLATWGIPNGPYLYVPVFGPRSARDLIGLAFDWQLSPVTQADDNSTRNGLFIVRLMDLRTDQFLQDFFRARQEDTYIWDRDIYTGRRYDDTWYDGDAPVNLDIYSTGED